MFYNVICHYSITYGFVFPSFSVHYATFFSFLIRRFSAYSIAASRTHAPSSCAFRLAFSLCLLHGPFTLYHLPEFIPVNLSKIIMLKLIVPFQITIRQSHAQKPLPALHTYRQTAARQLVIRFFV
jgi:hypothetical protein